MATLIKHQPHTTTNLEIAERITLATHTWCLSLSVYQKTLQQRGAATRRLYTTPERVGSPDRSRTWSHSKTRYAYPRSLPGRNTERPLLPVTAGTPKRQSHLTSNVRSHLTDSTSTRVFEYGRGPRGHDPPHGCTPKSFQPAEAGVPTHAVDLWGTFKNLRDCQAM